MNRKNVLASLGLAALLSGCMVHGSGSAHVSGPVAYVEVEQEPPPPRQVHVVHRPGYVWIEGRWDWRGGQWVWLDGRYEAQRTGFVWAPGRWERRGRRHVWVEGRWNASAAERVEHDEYRDEGVRVRDHRREERREDRRDDGPVIRDHRR